MLIDTHKAIEKLIGTGNKKENAEAIVEIISSVNDKVATKSDIERLESKIDSVKWMLGLVCALSLMTLSLILTSIL